LKGLLTNDRVYVSGPITGLPEYKHVFRVACLALGHIGWNHSLIINPVIECEKYHLKEWADQMARCIEIFPRTGTLVRLPGWESSIGAQIENALAHQRGLVIVDLVGSTLKLADDYLGNYRETGENKED